MPITLLSDLADGADALVVGVVSASPEIDAVALRRLGEIGFIGGEPVRLLRRGPGGREPIAVLIGETLFALRLLEARCIEVTPVTAVTTTLSPRPAVSVAPSTNCAAETKSEASQPSEAELHGA